MDVSNLRIRYSYKKTDILNNAFTVCEIEDADRKLIARGISICSILDNHIRKKSRNIAFGRAMKALISGENSYEIIPDRNVEFWIEKIIISDSEKLERAAQEAIQNNLLFCPAKKNDKSGIKIDVPKSYPIKVAAKYFQFKSEYMPDHIDIYSE
jgi:hypothetical protein